MLDQIRKRQRWLTAFFIFAIGIVFVFFLGLGGSQPGGGPTTRGGEIVVELDGTQIQLSDYLRVRAQQEARIKASLGEQFDASSFSSFLDSQALGAIVNNVVMSQSALDLGLVVSPEEVKDLLRHDPSLRDANGRFDQQRFDDNIKWDYGSQAAYLGAMQRDLLQQKLYELLVGQAQVGDAEAQSAGQYRIQEVRIAYVAIDAKTLPEDLKPGAYEVQQHLEDNLEALQAAYDADDGRFSTPEQVMMRHILITNAGDDWVNDGVDDGVDGADGKRARAEEVLERLAAGEQFADLASEYSGDPSSKDDGGKLGLIGRGDVAPNLEAVVFALEPGQPSEIVEGIEGLHIVWVDEKIESGKTGFDEAGMTLASEGAAEETANRLAKEISDAVAGGQSLEDAARNAGFTLERTGLFTRRRDGFIPGLAGASLEILATAFSLDLDAPSSKRIFEVGNKQVLIQLLDRPEPDPAVLADAVTRAKDSLSRQRQNELLQAWVDDRRKAFENQQRLVVNAALIADR